MEKNEINREIEKTLDSAYVAGIATMKAYTLEIAAQSGKVPLPILKDLIEILKEADRKSQSALKALPSFDSMTYDEVIEKVERGHAI